MVEIANIREQCSWIHKDMADGHRKGHHPRQGGGCQGQPERAPDRRRKPGDQAGAGHRRRHRRHPDRAGHRRRGLRGGHRGEEAHHRRQDGPAGQDLPHAGLRGLHPDPEDGGRGAEREDPHLSPTAEVDAGQGLRGQLHGDHHAKRPAMSKEDVCTGCGAVHRESAP